MVTAGGFDFKENAEKVLADAISAAVDPASGVPVRGHAAEGNPAQVLLDAADGADLLVVGSRGHADSPRHCSARSASTAFITRTAPLS